MKQRLVTLIGKSVRKASQLRGSGGSALPGLVVERIDPGFLQRTLSQLPHGVVLVSGTNGKTTTTKMVVELLESQGLKVFTNRTGSNFTRGIVAALIESTNSKGHLAFDIAVLELDEAYAVKFSSQIAPAYSLFLNVFRDQLDRFGEIDTTAHMLRKVAERTTKGVVINRDDPRLASELFRQSITAQIYTYGVRDKIRAQFPSDDAMRAGDAPSTVRQVFISDDTCLEALHDSDATVSYGNHKQSVSLKLKGIYNIQNATGAVALTRLILQGKLNENAMLNALQNVTPAFGRGEDIIVNGQPVELVLVKNPSGFRLGLASFDPTGTATMIAINDNYADGRDMSWLWDVDFDSLRPNGVAMVSGIRGYDMALRLQYDEVEVKKVETNTTAALADFLKNTGPKRIYCTYTAMLALRKELGKIADMEKIL
jgi:UDP-N-acetylmuramyl tripeptide synthase